jgi:hypothetical protein
MARPNCLTFITFWWRMLYRMLILCFQVFISRKTAIKERPGRCNHWLHVEGSGVDAPEIAEGSAALFYKLMRCLYKHPYEEQTNIRRICAVWYHEIRQHFRMNTSPPSPTSKNKPSKKPRFNSKSDFKLHLVVNAYLILITMCVAPNKLIFYMNLQ